MKTDARFVENIKHIHQLRTYLCGKSDALTLTARQRCRSTVQRKVIEAHIEQKAETAINLLKYL